MMKSTPSWFKYPKYHWQNKHAVIVGAGIAGTQMAWHLCQQGWKVTLIERHADIATEASGNPAGVISPKMTAQQSMGESFYTSCFTYTLSLLKALKKQKQTIYWDACGVLQLNHNQREEKRWLALKARDLSTDFLQLLNSDEASTVAGIPLTQGASYFPQGGWINPSSYCSALSNHPNCHVLNHTEAIKLIKINKKWQLLNNTNEVISETEVIIICSGKDLGSFEQSKNLPTQAVAGQTTISNASTVSDQLKTVIGHEGYLTPALNFGADSKQHIFGATFDRDTINPHATTKADDTNLQQLNKHLPQFSSSLSHKQSAHTAVRMTTPDRFPYVGALADNEFYQSNYADLHQGKKWKVYPPAHYQEGLFVLGGLGSRGLTTSGLCAKYLVDLIENKLNSKEGKQLMQNCHPARFLIKNLKRNIK